MLYWSECDVSTAISAASRAGQASHLTSKQRHKLFADSIVGFGIADAWLWHCGHFNPKCCDAGVTWLETCGHMPNSVCLESQGKRYDEELVQLAKRTFDSETREENAVNVSKKLSAVFPKLGERNALVCLNVASTGCVFCIEFLRFDENQLMYSQRDVSLVNMLFTVSSDAPFDPSVVSDSELSTEVQHLPKRQHEVLEQILLGACVKEIASHLGISRHTVNDYTKSLYRRFSVSGRSELVALFFAGAFHGIISGYRLPRRDGAHSA